jgi:glyoxylate reductase
MASKIVWLSPTGTGWSENLGKWFASAFDEVVVVPPNSTEEEICKLVKGATVIGGDFKAKNVITKKILEAAEDVKLIQYYSVSYAGVDLEAAHQMGIPVANNPGWNSHAVAEHTLMMILVLLKKILYIHKETSEARWLQMSIWREIWELRGKTLGILGFGSIGRALAELVRPFGAKILYHKRSRLTADEEDRLNIEYRGFTDLLRDSDIVSIHVPLSDETRGLIGEKEIELMKQGAILINASRGEVVDAEAVRKAIISGRISGAGVDVFDPEPIEPTNPLIGLDNVLLTCHIAGASSEALKDCMVQCMENINRVLSNQKPRYIVNNL